MNIEAIRARAVEKMTGIPEPPCEPGYRLHHGQRVEALALDIAQREKLDVNRDHLAIGALLHDIGKATTRENESHGEKGADIVRAEFADLMDADDLEAVAQIVLHHYDRPNSIWFDGKDKPAWPKEILIVQDADMLDHFGVPGIWLTLHWAAHKDFTPARTNTDWFTSEYMCSWRREARRSINFTASRRMLELRIAQMDDFFRQLK
ncbi:MAG: HD domain-containing protein [Kiritimatiellia bacterium]|jgi:putative nucleotidyltransferase with HDIG domain